MDTINRWAIIFLLLIFPPFFLNSQNPPEAIQFRNAPVLFTEKGQTWQQLIANCEAIRPGQIRFLHDGEMILESSLKKGNNKFLLTLPAVDHPRKISLTTQINNQAPADHSVEMIPPEKWEIFFVQHSHTDIGYTRPQSEILAEQIRYIDYALDFCDQTDHYPEASRFRWTCESAWVTFEFLRNRPASQVERFLKRIDEGRIEVTAMLFNMAEIADENTMVDFLNPLKAFKKYEIPVHTAMQNDVNGIAWCMPDYFKSTGVKYLNMGINETRSIRPFDKPTSFWWESPSGERLLATRNDHYMTGNRFQINTPENFSEVELLDYLAGLKEKEYPFKKVAVQFSGYRTDNAPPSTGACDVIREWNKKYEYPKLKMAVAGDFFKYVEKNHGSELPVYKNAWLDWWSDGFGSSARETAEVRKTQNLKQVDEGIFAMVNMLGGTLSEDCEEKIAHISENALFYDEHTYGAAESISDPFSVNSMRQWLQKGAYAWEALKKVTLLHEDALGRLQQFLRKAPYPVIYVINSMGWDRPATVELFIDYEILPPDKAFSIIDLSSGEEVPVQFARGRREGAYWLLEAGNVPALGVKALKIQVSDKQKNSEQLAPNNNREVLENQYFRIAVDKKTGGIKEFYDKGLKENLYDPENPYFIGQPVRETLPERGRMEPSHTTVKGVRVEKGIKGDVWKSIRVFAHLEGFSEGTEEDPKGIQWEIRLFNHSKKVEFAYKARKEIVTDPEALYVAFPFRLPDSRIVFETIGGTLTQGAQLPGSASDWNVAQNFVSVRGKKGQIVMVSNEVPLWHFSDFNIGKFERYPEPGKPWLYSWVMNNYWFTNFRAFQTGAFEWTYSITTTPDTTNTAATKLAWGVRNPLSTRTFPAGKSKLATATLKTLNISGAPNAVLVNSRPAFKGNGNVILHFREVDGLPAEIQLSSEIPDKRIKSVKQVNILGETMEQLDQNIAFEPYEVKFIELSLF